jgi:hypothetical protein
MPDLKTALSLLVMMASSVCAYSADRLPDGGIARFGSGNIRAAWYTAPTTRYTHGVLGDAIEGGGLAVQTAQGVQVQLTLPESEVFEDITPRLADLDGDGNAEVISILSSVQKGGSLAVYSLRADKLVLKAKTPFIGRPNRWLNVAGIADYGSGLTIALVKTPHIGGELQFWQLSGNRLARIEALEGFSNHFIGSRALNLSATLDTNGDGALDIVVPSADRRALRVITLKGGVKELHRIQLGAPVSGNIKRLGGTRLNVPVGGRTELVDVSVP